MCRCSCNKVTCSVCNNSMCWLCGKQINGYAHFNDPKAKCILFDPLDGTGGWHMRNVYDPNANREAPAVSKVLSNKR